LPQLPLRLYQFSDGLFVVDAAEPYRRWIGSQVLRVGTLEPAAALHRIEPYVSRDNEVFLTAVGPGLYLPTAAILRAAGVIPDAAQVPLVLRDRAGRSETVTFTPAPPGRLVRHLTPPAVPDAPPPPLYLRRQEEAFWFEHLPERDALYVQVNSIRDAPGEPLHTFARRLRAFVDEHPVRVLVLDLRHNPGGDRVLLPSLLRALVHFETTREDARLFVITGRATLSAAQVLVNHAYFMTNATIAGERSSSRPNFVGEDTEVRLPHSGLYASISSLLHQSNPLDNRPWISPQLPVELSSADYFANRDPVLEAIWGVLAASPGPGG
jgi:hypothetical protein